MRRALKARAIQPEGVFHLLGMVLHPTPQYSGKAVMKDSSSNKKGTSSGSSSGSGGGGGSSSSGSSTGDVRMRVLSSWEGASAFAGVMFTVGKCIVQPVLGNGSEWVCRTMMPAMIWVVTWMIEEGVYDHMAAVAGGGGGSGSSSSSGTAAGGGGGGGDETVGSGSSRSSGTAAATAAAAGDDASALTEEAAAAHMVVLIAAARLLLVCYEGLVALQAAEEPLELPTRASSSSTSRTKEYIKPKSGSSSSSKSTSAASNSSSKVGLVKVGRGGGKSDADIRCLEVFGALEEDHCGFARLLGLGCYCLMKRLQQGEVATAAAATAAVGGGGGGCNSSSSQGIDNNQASRPSSSSSAAAAAAAALATVLNKGASAVSKEGSKKATSMPVAPKWAGMVTTHLPETVLEALQHFETIQGLVFLQGLCARVVRTYQEGVQKDGVGLMLPLADWEIFPKGYTGALLCNEVQMCAPLLVDAPYRMGCSFPGCDSIEGHYEAPAVKKCSGCGVAAYCSRGCQTEHWPEHREVCKRLQKEAAAAAAAAGVQQLSLQE